MTQLTFKCLTSPIDRSEKWRTWVMIVLSWILSWLSASLAVFIRSRSACSPVTSLWPRLTSASSSACTTAAFDSRSSVNHRYKHYPLSVSTDWVVVLRPTRQKTGHFGDVSSWLGMEKTKPNTTKACFTTSGLETERVYSQRKRWVREEISK